MRTVFWYILARFPSLLPFLQDDWEEVTHMSCGRSGHGVAVGVESSYVAKAAQMGANASSTLIDDHGAVIDVSGSLAGGAGSGGGGVNISDLTVDDVGL